MNLPEIGNRIRIDLYFWRTFYMRRLAVLLASASFSSLAFADVGPPIPMPEPGFYPEFGLMLACLVFFVGLRPLTSRTSR